MSLIERSLPIIGEEGAKKLNNARIAVFGVGGVGSWCAEALVRSGIGEITVIDGDTVSETNRNRQLIAALSSVGKPKAEVCAARLRDINPDCSVTALNLFYSAETASEIGLSRFDYIADCIDTVTSKLLLIQTAKASGTPIISSMGTGNRLDPSQIIFTDLFKTSGDPLARVMRKELKKRGISELSVVCSAEPPGKCFGGRDSETNRATPSSACFVPATAGLRIAYEITREIINNG